MGKVCLSVVMVMTPIMVSAGNISLLAFIWVAILLDWGHNRVKYQQH